MTLADLGPFLGAYLAGMLALLLPLAVVELVWAAASRSAEDTADGP
jgi:hypothetical protein